MLSIRGRGRVGVFVMRVVHPVLLASACTGFLAAGCGDLSQEDLLFLAALPSRAEMELRPAGAASGDTSSTEVQALERSCEPSDLRCTAQNVAARLNGLTFGLLDVIDRVTARPATRREPGRRIWGPRYDDRRDVTTRFEMTRSDDSASFAFCVHVAAGQLPENTGAEVGCDVDVDEASGLALLVAGSLQPGSLDGARARSGKGSMRLDLTRLPNGRGAGRGLEIDFDNTTGRDIAMTLIGAPIPGTDVEREPAHYAFTRDPDGAGTFAFDAIGNLVRESARLELLRIGAQWQADQAGRADATVTGGDAPAGFGVTQCWGADGSDVYLARGAPPDVEEFGEAGACSFTASALVDGDAAEP